MRSILEVALRPTTHVRRYSVVNHPGLTCRSQVALCPNGISILVRTTASRRSNLARCHQIFRGAVNQSATHDKSERSKVRDDVPPPQKKKICQMINFVRAVIKVLTFVKIRTYAKSAEELWLEEWTNPLQQQVPIENPIEFLDSLQHPNRPIEGQVFSPLFFHFLTRSS